MVLNRRSILCCNLMKPAKLIRHLESKHKEFNNKTYDFFIQKSKELTAQTKVMSIISTVPFLE